MTLTMNGTVCSPKSYVTITSNLQHPFLLQPPGIDETLCPRVGNLTLKVPGGWEFEQKEKGKAGHLNTEQRSYIIILFT